MKNLVWLLGTIGLIGLSYAVPAPCSTQKLLQTSDYAIEGVVTNIQCEKSYQSKECKQLKNKEAFVPELRANCKATVKITKTLKGTHKVNDTITIPFQKITQQCKNGNRLIPGSPNHNFEINKEYIYYNTSETSCKYRNLEQINKEVVMCTQQYDPVCGIDGRTYGNACMAHSTKIAHKGECKKDTPKICTREYDPVCDVNGITHNNTCIAGKAKIAHKGECKKNETNICPEIYAPVCGTDGHTYENKCSAGEITIAHKGKCKQNTLKAQILRGNKHNITKYKNPKDYRPNDRLTREEATKMITTTLSQAGVEIPYDGNKSCTWTDEKTIDPTLIQSVRQSCQQSLLRGGDDGRFMPRQAIEYRQMEIILARISAANKQQAKHLPTFTFAEKGPITRGKFIHILHKMFHTYKTNNKKELQSDLTQAIALRKKKGSTSYNITQTKSCFCMKDYVRPMTYDVVSGSTHHQNATYADDQKPVTVDVSNSLLTIDQAFAMIQKAIDTNADKITVTYDAEYGYPTKIFIDQSFTMADEEMRYTYKINNTKTSPIAGNYTLTTFNGEKAPADITLTITQNQINAKICNIINGSYTIDEKNIITFEPMTSTMMACEGKLSTIESAFTSITTPLYDKTKPNTLTLKQGDNTFVFTNTKQ